MDSFCGLRGAGGAGWIERSYASRELRQGGERDRMAVEMNRRDASWTRADSAFVTVRQYGSFWCTEERRERRENDSHNQSLNSNISNDAPSKAT